MADHKIYDYIHYRYSNYKAHGLRMSSGRNINPTSVCNEHKTQIMNQVSAKTALKNPGRLDEFNKALNFFFSGGGDLAEKKFQDNDKDISIEQAIDRMFVALVQKLEPGALSEIKATNRSWATMTATNKFQPNKIIGQSGRQSDSIYLKPLNDALRLLEQQYEEVVNKVYRKGSVNQKNQEKLTNMWKQWDAIKAKCNIEAKKVSKTEGAEYTYTGKIPQTENTKNFVSDLQKFYKVRRYTRNTEVMGKMLEYYPIILQYLMNQTIDNNIDNLVEGLLDNAAGTVTGSTGASFHTYDKNALSFPTGAASKNQNYSNWNAQISGWNHKIVADGTKLDKVDLKIKMTPNDEEYKISAKNYDVSKAIWTTSRDGLQVGSYGAGALLKFLQLHSEFATHYFNITAEHKEADDTQPEQSEIDLAHKIAKYIIIAYGISGGIKGMKTQQSLLQSTEMGNVFLVADHSQNPPVMKAVSIASLLNNLEKLVENTKIKGYPTGKWENEMVDKEAVGWKERRSSAYARCVNIVGQAEKYKLTIHISPSLLGFSK